MDWNLEEALAYYQKQGAPGDQTALVSLLREVQSNCGGIPQSCCAHIADRYGIRESFLLALIKRIPSLRLENTHILELCCGPNCGKAAALAEAAEALCGSAKGAVIFKRVGCMRMCGKGPNLTWDGKLYHRADPQLLRRLAEEAALPRES